MINEKRYNEIEVVGSSATGQGDKMKRIKSEDEIRQNLTDAGCASHLSSTIMSALNNGKLESALKLLTDHRRSLLDTLHAQQRCLDCLDYLLFQLQKCEGTGEDR